MPGEPINFVDGLVRGIILTAYDFVCLVVGGLVPPFTKHSRRLWPIVLTTQKRLSSLTYLVLCVTMAMAIATGNDTSLASRALNIGQKTDAGIIAFFVMVLLISVAIDLIIRVGFLFVDNSVRCRLYEGLVRISTANIFLGTALIMLFVPGEFFLTRADKLMSVPLGPIVIASPPVYVFAIALGVLAPKAFGIRQKRLRILFGLTLCLIAPLLVINISLWSFKLVNDRQSALSSWFFPDQKGIEIGQFTKCRLSSNIIHVSSYMILSGRDWLVIEPKILAIYGANKFIAKVKEDHTEITLLKSTAVKVNLTARYSSQQSEMKLSADGNFDCELKFLGSPTQGWGEIPVVSDRE